MKIGRNIGINPLVWGDVTQAQFLKRFKGEEDEEALKLKHKECVEIFKESQPNKK